MFSSSRQHSSTQGIGFSPTSPQTSSGIPSFRSLRSFLPFGPSKNPVSNAPIPVSSPNTSRSPFSGFGSAKRSIQKDRERIASFSAEVTRPVITIQRSASEDVVVRRSVSLSDLERPDVDSPTTPKHSTAGFALRTPSPGPPLSVELSTIMEADNSGVSKDTLLSLPVTPRSRPIPPTAEEDSSTLDHVADQVRDAILSSDKQWRNADKSVVIIDVDEKDHVPDTSFYLENPDPQLMALLSPNTLKKSPATKYTPLQPPISAPAASSSFGGSPSSRLPRTRQPSSFLPRLRPSTSPSPSTTSQNLSQFSPSPILSSPKLSPAKGKTQIVPIYGNDNTYPSSSSQLPAPVPIIARKNGSLSTRPGKLFTPDRSNSLSPAHTKAFTPQNQSDSRLPPPTTSAKSQSTRTLRRVVLGMTGYQSNNSSPAEAKPSVVTPTPSPSRFATTFGRASFDLHRTPTSSNEIGLGRPSLEIRRGDSFDSRRRPSPSSVEPRSSMASERTASRNTQRDIPDHESEVDTYEDERRKRSWMESSTRPSLESAGTAISRPGSAAAKLLEKERKTPSSRMFDSLGDRLATPRMTRTRKRSMSVQERVHSRAGNRLVTSPANIDNSVPRPGSSLSVGRPSRGGAGQGVSEYGEKLSASSGPGLKLEWLGPRTIKAFRAAGLLDPDREKTVKERETAGVDSFERLRERSGSVSGMLAPSPLRTSSPGSTSALNRSATLRSSSEYIPGSRAQSRMAYSQSEIGGTAFTSRRGSESLSAYSSGGGGNGYNLMESPTLTVSGSSGSDRGERDLHTPRSASTAPTSLSDNFGYLVRDREKERDRDRDREEIKELKDRHATEVGALLGALSDSQRTVRLLRDENSGLRERTERFAGIFETNQELMRVCEDLQRECETLRRECAGLRRASTPVSFKSATSVRAPGIASSWSGGSTNTNSSSRSNVPKLAISSPLATDLTPRYEEHEYNDTIIIHNSIDDSRHQRRFTDDSAGATSPLDELLPSSTSTPSANRRHSNTSSIFPAPPPNMTMLLDDEALRLPLSNRSSTEHSQFHFQPGGSPIPSKPLLISSPKGRQSLSLSRSSSSSSLPPASFQKASYASSISPTTADFSMISNSSPRSLFLRPEHEQLLGDMESLDLGAIPPIELGVGSEDW